MSSQSNNELVLLGRTGSVPQSGAEKARIDEEWAAAESPATAPSSGDESDRAFGKSGWGLTLCGCTCLVMLIAGCAYVVTARIRGENAAAAVMEAFGAGGDETMQLEGGESISMTALLDRAGRGAAAEDWHSFEEEHDPSYNPQSDMPDAPYNRALPSGKSAAFWGNTWIKLEMNRLLEWKKEEMNNNTAAMVEQMGQPQMSEGEQVKIDAFSGLDSMKFDTFEVTKVLTDLDKSTAVAYMQLKGHTTSPLRANGKANTKSNGKGSWYHFTIQVNNFWIAARRIKAEAELGLPPVMKQAKVNWVDSGFGRLDCTCYSKKNPSKVDGMCTRYMKGAMEKQRGSMIAKISQKLTSSMQEKFDSELTNFKGM